MILHFRHNEFPSLFSRVDTELNIKGGEFFDFVIKTYDDITFWPSSILLEQAKLFLEAAGFKRVEVIKIDIAPLEVQQWRERKNASNRE